MILGIAHLDASLSQSWPPFVLVAGLLLLGHIAGADGLFEAAASRLVLRGSPVRTLLACMGLVLVVTALLNLDTAAVFLTPVLVGAARRRGVALRPFLYAGVFMANASSLFLPGSNLTNLLVLSGHRISGGAFLVQMLPAALSASLVTAIGLIVIHRRALHARPDAEPSRHAPVRLGAGLLGAGVAALLMVLLSNPALPVLAVALLLVLWRWRRGGSSPAAALAALGLPALLGLFLLAVALGVLARSGVISLSGLHAAGPAATTSVAALASVFVNNLPAAVLLSATGHLQTRALLIGLNVGPNLAGTGSLAVLLWWRSAKAAGAEPSLLDYSRQGLVLAPLAMLAALSLSAV